MGIWAEKYHKMSSNSGTNYDMNCCLKNVENEKMLEVINVSLQNEF